MNRNLAVAIVVLAACGGKSAEECRTEAESLSKLLRDTPHELMFHPHQDVTLAKRSDLRDTGTWKSIVVIASAETLATPGTRIGGKDDLRTLLEGRRKAVPSKDHALYLQLDRATPWSRVVELVDMAKSVGHTRIGFAFATDDKLTPPPRTPIDDKLDALSGDPADRATELAKLVETVIEDCPALTKEFGKVGAESTESKADVLIKGLAPALIECKCNVDMPALRAVMWRVMAVEPNIKVLTFEVTSGDKLAFPSATTWEVASKRLSPGTNYQFVTAN